MKLQIVSDLHLDLNRELFVPNPDADVCIIAGDVANGRTDIIETIAVHNERVPVVFVPGNHDYYTREINETNAAMQAIADRYEDFYFLENETVTIKGQRFVGTCLWAGFNLNNNPTTDSVSAQLNINDFRYIKYGDRTFNVNDCTMLFVRARDFLHDTVSNDDVVVTHFGISRKSIHDRFNVPTAMSMNAYFVNDMENDILALQPKLWVHGHVHSSMQYSIDKTRVVINPRGYGSENPDYAANMLIEI